MKRVDAISDWQVLLSYLPRDFEKLAREHRLLNTQWPNAKVKTAAELLRLILVHVGADLPLRQTVATVKEGGGVSVSQVWLHQKMRRAQPYLSALVGHMTSDIEQQATPERWAGYEMVCLDGSTVSAPGSVGTDARIHAVVRLHDLKVLEVRVTDATGGETLRRFLWEEGQLVIVDRGYSNGPGIASAVKQGADVLVRVNRGSLRLVDEHGQGIDALDWCRGLPGHRATERAAHVAHGRGKRQRTVAGRLIGFRLPEQQADEARERVRREHGSGVTDEQLEASAYVILFTTAAVGRLSAARCIEAYRLRWQVELQFKRWKSLCHFDRLPNYRDDTICSWLTAKVLLGLLLDRIDSETTPSSSRPMARQAWKLTAIVWPLIVAALLPIRLAEAAQRMPAIADHLDELDGNHRPRQVDAFRDRFYQDPTNGASANY